VNSAAVNMSVQVSPIPSHVRHESFENAS
jgi:hypothetical protein